MDSRIDAYIEKSADFAKPILEHLRDLVHSVCPDVTEKIKWGMPFFDYQNEMMCHMASFKHHAVFGFWKASIMKDPVLLLNAQSEAAMGHLGKITSLKDLPSDKQIKSWLREAMLLNENGIKLPAKVKTKAAPVSTPDFMLKAFKKNKKAFANYEAFSNSCKKEYINWITEAKTEVTRDKRLATALEWVAEGKQRDWKYKKP